MNSSILIAGAFAGVVAVAVTVAIERFGGRVGGLLGTLPTTVVPAALGIAAQLDGTGAGSQAFGDAINSVPAGMLLNVGFLYMWRVVPPRLSPSRSLGGRLALTIAVSLGAWLAGATGSALGLRALRASGVGLRAFGVVTTTVIAVAGVLACLRPRPAPRGRQRPTPAAIALRGVLAALAVSGATAIARTPASLAAGIAACFPAIFVTTMVSLWVAQGEAVPAGAIGPMMLGSTSIGAYAVLVSLALPRWGMALGSLGAWGGAVCVTTAPAWAWLQARARRTAADRAP